MGTVWDKEQFGTNLLPSHVIDDSFNFTSGPHHQRYLLLIIYWIRISYADPRSLDDEVKATMIVIGASVGGLLLAYLVCVLLCCVSSKCPLRSVWSSCELSKQ